MRDVRVWIHLAEGRDQWQTCVNLVSRFELLHWLIRFRLSRALLHELFKNRLFRRRYRPVWALASSGEFFLPDFRSFFDILDDLDSVWPITWLKWDWAHDLSVRDAFRPCSCCDQQEYMITATNSCRRGLKSQRMCLKALHVSFYSLRTFFGLHWQLYVA